MTLETALSSFTSQSLLTASRSLFKDTLQIPLSPLADAAIEPKRFFRDSFNEKRHSGIEKLYLVGRVDDRCFQPAKEHAAAEALGLDALVEQIDVKDYSGMFIVAAELGQSEFTRSDLAARTREINRVFSNPVIVVFRHISQKDPVISIGVIGRREHKRDKGKDVLGQVSMIREIRLQNPHRGHLEILKDFSLAELEKHQGRGKRGQKIDSFKAFHAALQEIFNTELLNKRFYNELANWYFWALPQVEFPADLEPDDEKRRATGLIRMLTRLIFCWFLKEKGLVPENLFQTADLQRILKGGPDIPVWDSQSTTSSTYYQAILQNLFFATLNQRMGKDSKGNPHRAFAKDEGFHKNKSTYDVNNLYRYEKLFTVPEEQALALFADIPFLNGGLFECLDRTEESGADIPVCDSSKVTFKKRYLDGFSRNAKKRPIVPDRLFFDSGETADLSAAYGDKKRKAEKVSGLISILNRYKFTIVENTPIDQEIALDPELLGKVFENLLASYNEETKTTARKQTGSFYTPRPIVDYMVDESLKAHLEQKVAQTILSGAPSGFQTGVSELPSEITKSHRNLPHWTKDDATYWITFRLADSLPQEKLTKWKAERDAWVKLQPQPWDDDQWKEYDEQFGQRLENWLDAGSGECVLRRPEVRALVEKCLRHFDGQRYDLIDSVIMPNHVHLLLRPKDGQALSKILQGIKGVSANHCNTLLGRTGQTFWQEESYDHIVRSQAQLNHFIRYIAENPVKAKLGDGEYSISKSSADNPVGTHSQEDQTGLSGLRSKLDDLFTYTEEPHQFSAPEVATLITAIDEVKILDPACGSGAFPMGVLHKLVYILTKLDPDNERWKATQLAKLDSAPMRDQLEAAFADNDDDYGRKLYLIENCLYGVDIQPIAIQISKLRFFISLVCDQRVEQTILSAFSGRQRQANLGIRPLPNLETKFVAANTLIGLPIPEPDLFIKNLIEPIEKEIEGAYHSHFNIQRRDQKIALQKRIKALRQKLSDTLLDGLGANKNSDVAKKAQHLADWDAFDPQASADFFDSHWMFGRSLVDGFDVIIGNPPYVNIEKIPLDDRERYLKIYGEDGKLGKRYDLYQLFIMKGIDELRSNGLLTLILPNTFLMGSSYLILRRKICQKTSIIEVTDLPQGVFESVTVDNVIILLRRERASENSVQVNKLNTRSSLNRIAEREWDDTFSIPQSNITAENAFKINVHTNHELKTGEFRLEVRRWLN